MANAATSSMFTVPLGPSLHVEKQGRGPTFLFQHGLCGSASQPAEVFPSDCGFQRVTVEARGHGQSECGDLSHLSIATFSDDFSEYIQQTCDTPIVVGGISMGAAIALRLAVTRPDLVRALVIARPAWVEDAAPENMKPNAEVGALLERYSREGALDAFRNSPTFARLAKEAPDNLTSLMGFLDRAPQMQTAALLQKISADGPGVTTTQIAEIDLPTLIIGHGRDAIHPLSHAQVFAELIPHSQLVEITPKATNKLLYISEFQSALRTFLEGLSR